jgi:hypothetical protein
VKADPTRLVGAPAPDAGPFPEASREARKLAAAILEVLAGARAPGEAARVLGVSLARYYQLEVRAVAGLVAACEDRRRRGRGRAGGELTALRRECEQLRRDCARQQALVRAARRTVGLAAPAPATPPPGGGKRRPRRPTARALKMAALLQQDNRQPEPSARASTTIEAPPEATPSNP